MGVLVFLFVFLGLRKILTSRFTHTRIYRSHRLELVWTAIPAVILAALAYPSLRLLYAMDELVDPQLTVKIVGRQWY